MAGRIPLSQAPAGALRATLVVLAGVGTLANAPSLEGQELSFRRSIPGEELTRCATLETPPVPDDESRSEAARLGSTALQSLILGERQRARELLERATGIDPSSSELAYQLGRVLEELGESEAAAEEYCRALGLQPEGPEAEDIRARLNALATALVLSIPEEARSAFRAGIEQADAGRFEEAAGSFRVAARAAPEWPEAHYNLGVARARAGEGREAASALERYLELEPDAPDAIVVSQQIGQLQAMPANLPSPGAALVLGVVPGMGQFYTGRPVAGLTFLTLAGAAAGAALFTEDVHIVCLTELDAGGQCPSGQVLRETTDHPLLAAGLGAAAAITIAGAVEAFVRARGRNGGEATGEPGFDLGSVTVRPPTVRRAGGAVEVSVLRLTFR